MKIFSLVILCLSLNVFAADVRTDFHKGMFSEDELTKITESDGYPNTLLTTAYKGVCYTMLADYQFLPTSKLAYFNNGKAYIDAVIQKTPSQVELRYLRLLVQLNCPIFLGYRGDITTDLNYFNLNIKSFNIANSWKKIFIENLLAGEQLTALQKNKLLALKKIYA